MKILVVLGKNSFGKLVVDALRTLPALRVFATRSVPGASECTLSLKVASTFGSAEGMDVVINCADPLVDAPPHRFADWCLRNGVLFVETTSHVPTLESLYFDVRRRVTEDGALPGAVLLGAGLSPGLTNLLARELSEPENVAARVELFFDGHPPLDAPSSRVEQLGELLRVNGARYQSGERIETPPVGPTVQLLDGHDYVRVCRAEALMLAWSGFASTTATYARAPRFALSVSSALLRLLPERAGTRALLLGQLLQARWQKRSGRPAERPIWPLRVTAMAGRKGDRRPSGSLVSLAVNDGDWAAACAAAVMAVDARHSSTLPGQVLFADRLFRLEPFLEKLRAAGGAQLSLTFQSNAAGPAGEAQVPEPDRRHLPLVGAADSELDRAQVA